MKIDDEFLDFLEEYKIIGLAIAFVIGVAVKDLVDSTVQDLVMPFVSIFLPGTSLEEFQIILLGSNFQIGHWLGTVIEFVIIAALIFLFVKYGLKKEEVGKI